MTASERTKTIQWHDPMNGALKARQMNGLAYLQAISDGAISYPPLLNVLDFEPVSITRGQAIFSFDPQEFHYNSLGTVHGGVISAILDTAMGCSLHSLLQAGPGYTTLELKVNFLKAITIKSGKLKAIGNIIHSGSRIALVEATLTDEKDTIYAHGTSTCMILNNTSK
jgi:uncharacterized protein (TIGR00369 family)